MEQPEHDYLLNNLIIITLLFGIGIFFINQAMPKNNYCRNISNSKLQDINSSQSVPYCYPDTKDYYNN